MSVQDDVRLDYPDPPVPVGLAGLARGRGRRLRRRRRAGAVTLAVVLVAGLGSAAYTVLTPPQTDSPARRVQDAAELPKAIGKGPSIDHFASGGSSADDLSAGDRTAPPAGKIHILDPVRTPDGRFDSMWVTKDANLCDGGWSGHGSSPQRSSCTPLTGAPAQGFWMSSAGSSADLPPNSHERQRVILTGIVRGPVTKVVVDLPEGPVEATLAPAGGDIGTLYWVVTTSFDMRFQTEDGRDYQDVVSRTAYRGDVPVFRCQEADCLAM